METFHPQISQIRADPFETLPLEICEGRNGCEATAGLSIRVLKICGPTENRFTGYPRRFAAQGEFQSASAVARQPLRRAHVADPQVS